MGVLETRDRQCRYRAERLALRTIRKPVQMFVAKDCYVETQNGKTAKIKSMQSLEELRGLVAKAEQELRGKQLIGNH